MVDIFTLANTLTNQCHTPLMYTLYVCKYDVCISMYVCVCV